MKILSLLTFNKVMKVLNILIIWKNLKHIVPFLVIGFCSVPIGVWILKWMDPNVVRLILALAIAIFVFIRGLFPTPKIKSEFTKNC